MRENETRATNFQTDEIKKQIIENKIIRHKEKDEKDRDK